MSFLAYQAHCYLDCQAVNHDYAFEELYDCQGSVIWTASARPRNACYCKILQVYGRILETDTFDECLSPEALRAGDNTRQALSSGVILTEAKWACPAFVAFVWQIYAIVNNGWRTVVGR